MYMSSTFINIGSKRLIFRDKLTLIPSSYRSASESEATEPAEIVDRSQLLIQADYLESPEKARRGRTTLTVQGRIVGIGPLI